jgi:hypothetical protein
MINFEHPSKRNGNNLGFLQLLEWIFKIQRPNSLIYGHPPQTKKAGLRESPPCSLFFHHNIPLEIPISTSTRTTVLCVFIIPAEWMAGQWCHLLKPKWPQSRCTEGGSNLFSFWPLPSSGVEKHQTLAVFAHLHCISS